MRKSLPALASGLLFGVGLQVSGMTDPARVRAFLDVGGDWNPSLAFVMAGAILVALPAFHVAERRLQLTRRVEVDARLLAGSALFGVGWGLSGMCPGPALVNAGRGLGGAALFVAAMLAGMGLFAAVSKRRQAGSA